jgi:hypothetical protein
MNTETKSGYARWRIDAGAQVAHPRTAREILAGDNQPFPTISKKPGNLHPAPRSIPASLRIAGLTNMM